MRYLIAPDSWKESMTALEAARAIERGIHRVDPDAVCDLMPMADGGEGTLDCLYENGIGEFVTCKASDPLQRSVEAEFLWLKETNTAIIETARVCGLMLLSPEERNPMITTTYGVGEIIRAAIKKGCRNIILTLGGSATNDGGSGMLSALGAKFRDKNGFDVALGGLALKRIHSIDLRAVEKITEGIHFTILCDVDNPLLGKCGATYVFAPQKGASFQEILILEQAMAHYAALMDKKGGPFSAHPGSGAAGGLGYGLLFTNRVKFQRGAQYIMDLLQMERRLMECDIVITGEGSMDSQSLSGKVPVAIAKMAASVPRPVVVFAGRISGDRDTFYQTGITAFFPVIKENAPLRELLAAGAENLEWAVENFVRGINLIKLHKYNVS